MSGEDMGKNYLEGAIDLHFHAGPDVRERKLTYLEAAFQARDAGMKAILIKSHSTITADIASLIQPLVKNILVFGGIALNYPVGGLNPVAVETALKPGAKQIWMPTLDAANQCHHEKKRGGITILTREGTLKKEVTEILEIVSRYDVILSTGHLSQNESFLLILSKGSDTNKKVKPERLLCEGAFQILMSGDKARHDQVVMEKASSAAKGVDVFVLAQASMARLESQIAQKVGKPVFSSPRLCVEKVKQMMERI